MKVSTIEVDGQRLKLYDSSDGRAKVGADSPHAHYAIARGDVHADASAFKFLASKVGPIGSVCELFGGSGWHTSIIQRLNGPIAHHVFEIDGDCVQSLKASFPAGVHVVQGDSYVDGLAQLKVASYDWVHADFNNLTFMRWRDALKPTGKLVHEIFKSANQWVTLTDSALFGLARFPQNREAYVTAFGGDYVKFTPRDYYKNVGDRIAAAWGFRLQHVVTWHSMAAMMLFRKTEDARPFAFTENKDKISVRVLSVEEVP